MGIWLVAEEIVPLCDPSCSRQALARLALHTRRSCMPHVPDVHRHNSQAHSYAYRHCPCQPIKAASMLLLDCSFSPDKLTSMKGLDGFRHHALWTCSETLPVLAMYKLSPACC